MPALTKAVFSTLDPAFRSGGTALFNLSRLYGSTIGIALVQIFFCDNTQAMHLAFAKGLAPPRALPRRRSCRGLDLWAGACRAQQRDHPPGGFRRGHRPIRGNDDRNADRDPACAVSPQAASGQLILVEPAR
jgi:hypothetical protein